MRAVINATGYVPELSALLEHTPSPLLQVINKPILAHIIEFLKQCEITQLDIILFHLPYKIENYIGDGTRWGIPVTYHLTTNSEKPFQTFVGLDPNETILLADGNLLPKFDTNPLQDGEEPTLYYFPDNVWSGWGILKIAQLNHWPFNDSDKKFKKTTCHHFIAVRSYLEWERSNQKLLNIKNGDHFFPSGAHQDRPGVWISHGARVHPSVQIKAPIYIGENSQIKENCTLGPHVIIEDDCLINALSTIERSLICHKSYVGEHLEIKNCIIDRHLLINLTLDTQITVKDDFILSELHHISFNTWLEKIRSKEITKKEKDSSSPLLFNGIAIQRLSFEESFSKVLNASQVNPVKVFWANAHAICECERDPHFKIALENADFLLNDGVGIELAGFLFGKKMKGNLNGTDWIPAFLDKINQTIFLLGGQQEVIEDAVNVFKDKWPDIPVVGYSNGYYEDEEQVLKLIEGAKPSVLLVGMGVPKQEMFIHDHWQRLQAAGLHIAIAGGAVFDFMTEKVSRAPTFLRKMRLEWIYRIWLEPKRLIKRYLRELLVFPYILFSQLIKKTLHKKK